MMSELLKLKREELTFDIAALQGVTGSNLADLVSRLKPKKKLKPKREVKSLVIKVAFDFWAVMIIRIDYTKRTAVTTVTRPIKKVPDAQ